MTRTGPSFQVMPRHTYWTIILADGPTSFRAREPETLLPTLKQLQSRHPDAVMKWFANGRLWDSPEHAREYTRLARETWRKTRGPDWRPGGSHRDPRARVKTPKPPRRKPAAGDGESGGPGPRPRPSGGSKPAGAAKNGRQRRPYRPTGGTRRGGGRGRT